MILTRDYSEEDIVPGTVHLLDLEGNLSLQKDESSKDNIILIPQPSKDPNDPLKWSKRKKNLQFGFLCFWAFMLAVAVNFTGPLYTVWTEDLNCTYTQLNISSALCFLFLGVGCAVLQPTALKAGRRFVYLICSLLILVSSVIGARASNINYLYVNNILGGFAAAPVDSLVEISTKDTFFKHEISSYMSYIIFMLYAGSDLGPVAAGYITDTLGWRWCYYIQIIIFAVLFIVQLFVMEDTTFARSEDKIESDILEQIRSRETTPAPEAMNEISGKGTGKGNYFLSEVPKELHLDSEEVLISGKRSYWQRMRLMELVYNDKRPFSTIFLRPIFLITFPAVVWGGLIYGAQMMWLSLLLTTQSEIYSVAPFNFTADQVGLTNLSAFVGSFIGMFYGGQFVDWLVLTLSRRNNGVFEPEFRVMAMIVPCLLNAGGILAYGLPAPRWEVSVIVGQGLLGFAMSSSGAICVTYAMECYPNIASESLVLMLVLRNAIGCGFTFAIQPWLDKCGLSLTTWLMFMLSLVINGSFVFIVLWGKSYRRWTKNLYEKYSDPNFGNIF